MAQVFHQGANTIARASIVALLLLAGGASWGLYGLFRSDYLTDANLVKHQPVPFSHKHHAGGVGIDCRYCHTSVETSSFAGLPPTETCMTCHSQIWADSPTLEPVRASFRDNTPIHWERIHLLPDFVYFDHSIHINKGIGCETCHGRVDEMPLMKAQNTLLMEWCLDCHRNPEKNIRPREEVFSMHWKPQEEQRVLGARLVKQYHVRKLTDCYTCHR